MKKKLLLSTIIYALIYMPYSTQAQAPDYRWATSSQGKGDDRGNKLAVDADGNVIVTGRYESKEITFGTITLKNSDQDSSTSDVFIVKYNAKAKMLWAKTIGGYGDDLGLHCATDKHGNIVLVGGYDCVELNVGKYKFKNKTRGEGSDIFVIKYAPDGEVIWAKSIGGTEHDSGYLTCAIDKNDDIFLTGAFYSKSFPIDSITLINSDVGGETFLAKFTSKGKLLWAKSAQSAQEDMTQSCAIDPQGNLIIAGYFGGPTFTLDSIVLNNAGGKDLDIFLAKYSTLGKLIWAQRFGGPDTDLGTCAVDSKGNIFLAGMYGDSILRFGNTNLVNHGNGNIFVTKLDAMGKVLWAKTAGGIGPDGVRNFCVDKNGSAIITGSFRSPELVFGNTTLKKDTTLIKPTDRTEDMFIAAYSTDGAVLWAKGAGGTGRNVGRSCGSDKNGNIYLTGSFDVPTFSLGTFMLINSGSSDAFTLKLSGNH